LEALNQNKLEKSIRACPMPSITRFSGSSSKLNSTHRWRPQHRFPLYFLFACVSGLFFLFIALFVPPIVWVQEGSTGSGTYYITVVLTIFNTPFPLFFNIIIGLLPISLIPLVERNSSLDRFTGAIIFAVLFALAYFVEQTQIVILTDAVWNAIQQPLYFTPWFTNPLSIMLMATTVIVGVSLGSVILSLLLGYFGEYLWTSLKGPFYVEGTRRTAVFIKGGERGTVLSIDHTSILAVNRKGGYFRGMVRPSKWQAYDRED
jgi:hypothetical protein